MPTNYLPSVAELPRVRRVHSWLPLVALRSHRAQPRGGREHPVRQGCRRGLRKVRGCALFPSPVLGWTLLGGGLRRVCGLRVDLGWSSKHETAGGCSTGTGINNAGNNLSFPCPTASASYNMCQTTTRLTDASACDAIKTSAFGDPHVASVTGEKFEVRVRPDSQGTQSLLCRCFLVSVCISSVVYHIFRGVTAVRPQLACVRDV